MKLSIIKAGFFITSLLIVTNGCDKSDECIKGKYIGIYCSGAAIEILDESTIGKSWTGIYDSKIYENSVVASIDSIYAKTLTAPDQYFTPGSVFYFKYRNGGYPRQTFENCEPSPFITITYLSTSPCP